jgi:hypothetical protein
MLGAAGSQMIGIDIDASAPGGANVADASARLLLPDDSEVRVGISGRYGVCYAPSRIGLALALALASDAPVHAADPLMERFMVPVEHGDPRPVPGHHPAAGSPA